MEFLFTLLWELIGELIIQLLFEGLFELGLRSLAATFQRPWHPVLASLGFNLWGAAAGGLSLMVFPHSMVLNPAYRIAVLFTVPFVMGFFMAQVGRLRRRKGGSVVALDRFWNGFAFAFAMALVRYACAR